MTIINNHTCPTCKNTRVSKDEKTCWKCGDLLHTWQDILRNKINKLYDEEVEKFLASKSRSGWLNFDDSSGTISKEDL